MFVNHDNQWMNEEPLTRLGGCSPSDRMLVSPPKNNTFCCKKQEPVGHLSSPQVHILIVNTELAA